MGFSIFSDAVTAGAANGVTAGIYVPIGDLPGIKADEFAASENDAVKKSKALKSVCHALYKAVSKEDSGLLGLTGVGTKTSIDFTTSEFTYTFTVEYITNVAGKSNGQIPLPTKGANMKSDKQSIKEVFPNAAVVAAEGAISGEGLVIETSTFDDYDDIAVTGVNTADDRDYIAALIRSLPNFTMLRDELTASAMTSFSLLDGATSFLDADATDETNPTTGIDPEKLSHIIPVSLTTTLSIETVSDVDEQTFDVNVVTA